MLKIEIKILTASEVEAFRAIRLSALEKSPQMFGSSYALEVVKPVEFFENCLLNSTVFGVYHQNQMIGVAALTQEKVAKLAHKAHLSSVFIAPEYRQNGVASKLLQAIVEYSRQHVEQILLSVAEGNNSAIHLYEKFGFRRYGVEQKALKEEGEYLDEILMKLFVE